MGGVIIKPRDYPPRLNDVPDKNALTLIKAPAMKIGNNNIYLDVLQVKDLSPHYKTVGFHVDGVLGMNVVNQYIWKFDNVNKKNYLHPFYDTQLEMKYSFCVPYDNSNGSPIMYVKKQNEYIPFVLSFGTDLSVINREYISTLNLKKSDEDESNDTTLNRMQDDPVYYYMDDFTFSGQQVKRDRFVPGVYSYLGTIFLNRFDKILLNPITHTFCFNHFNTQSIPKIYRRLTILANNGEIKIAENIENSLNKLGLKNGDIIVSVNNIKYPTDQIILVRKVITYSRTLNLEIKRDGKIIPVTIKQ